MSRNCDLRATNETPLELVCEKRDSISRRRANLLSIANGRQRREAGDGPKVKKAIIKLKRLEVKCRIAERRLLKEQDKVDKLQLIMILGEGDLAVDIALTRLRLKTNSLALKSNEIAGKCLIQRNEIEWLRTGKRYAVTHGPYVFQMELYRQNIVSYSNINLYPDNHIQLW
jgi:hypothetical protein